VEQFLEPASGVNINPHSQTSFRASDTSRRVRQTEAGANFFEGASWGGEFGKKKITIKQKLCNFPIDRLLICPQNMGSVVVSTPPVGAH
jgi:hypothetical protein